MDTTNGVWSCGESSFGKGKEISNSISEGLSKSYIVVMAGRWIMYDNGAWDFKIDNDKMGRTVDCSKIKGVDGLKESIYAEYCLLGREILAEMSYWLNDGECDMVGVGAAPVQITADTDYKIFRALHRADKSVNVFVTFREFVGGEMIFLRMWDHASVFPRQHSFSEHEKEKICGGNSAVDNGKNKEANVEVGCGVNPGSDDLPQQNYMAIDSGENKGDDMGEDEDDDGDYDYNYWHEYCRNDCVTDEEDDFEGSPPKRRGGGQTGSNCNRRSRPMSGRGQGSGKPASGRGQRTSATGVSKATKKACIRRRSEVNTDEVRDIYALLEHGDTGKSVDVVLVTPPKQYNKHIRVSEDNDEAVDPPITQCTDDDFVESVRSGHDGVGADDDFVESVRSGDTGQSVDFVLFTLPKQYNKHIRVIEDDDEAVDPPITECMEGHDGVGADDEFVDPRRCTPRKQNCVIEDSEEFVDPPITQSTQVQGGASFMRESEDEESDDDWLYEGDTRGEVDEDDMSDNALVSGELMIYEDTDEEGEHVAVEQTRSGSGPSEAGAGSAASGATSGSNSTVLGDSVVGGSVADLSASGRQIHEP
ncbi:hypothetical protein YC2023_041440 [Brassica napus]